MKYGLPDPLQYFQHQWRADRWRANCKKVVHDYWDELLLSSSETSSLKYFDTEYASTAVPMRIWQLAGLCSEAVRRATVVCWMILGVYFTQELLFKMKKTKTAICLGCNVDTVENLSHILLHCSHYKEIRESYLPQLFTQNKGISDILDDEDKLILSILDPLSSKLPEEVIQKWDSANTAYKLSREFCYNVHMKREKIYRDIEKES